jgi:hypothetical protein
MKKKPDLKRTADHWLSLVQAGNTTWVKVVSYKVNAFYAFHQDQPLPPCPFPPELDKPNHLMGGSAGQFLSSDLKGENRESLLLSIKQSKKGMPRPDSSIQKQTKKDFVKLVTTAPPKPVRQPLLDWADIPEDMHLGIPISLSQENFKQQIERTVDELFESISIEELVETQLHAFFPSTSANYIFSRKKGGAVGVLLDDPEVKLLRKPRSLVSFRVKHNTHDESISNDLTPEVDVTFQTNKLVAEHRKLLAIIRKRASLEVPRTKVVALAEALKVRIITSMPPYQQMTLNGISRCVQNALKKNPCFVLTHTPVTELNVLDRMGFNLKDDQIYLSADYKSATDNLHSWATDFATSRVSHHLRLGDFESALYKSSLTGNLIPVGEGAEEEYKEQKRAQLMGSRGSFGILCILNATVCRWALELATNRIWTLRDAPIMINGDDACIRGPKSLYSFWSKIAAFIGLEESVGKTYVSNKFLEINSACFRRTEPFNILQPKEGGYIIRKSQLRQVHYVNMGLVAGLKRSTSVTQSETPVMRLGTLARELIRIAPEKLHDRVMREFMNRHRKRLEGVHLPWFIPQWLGGIGLPIGSWGQPSNLDLRIARRILINWAKARPEQEIPSTPWKVWKKASERLPPPVYTTEKDQGTEYYTRAIEKECLSLILDSRVDLSDLFEEQDTVPRDIINHNQKLWQVTSDIPPPLGIGQLEYIQMHPNWRTRRERSEVQRTGTHHTDLD